MNSNFTLQTPPEADAPREAEGSIDTTLLPVFEERLQVDKRVVDRGGWRITKRIGSHEETVDELLRDRQVLIERRPIGRTLDGAEMPQQRYEGEVLVLPVVKEVLFTEKRLVLVEEIRITQRASSRRETQQVTLRNEEISIERLGPDESPEPGLATTPEF